MISPYLVTTKSYLSLILRTASMISDSSSSMTSILLSCYPAILSQGGRARVHI